MAILPKGGGKLLHKAQPKRSWRGGFLPIPTKGLTRHPSPYQQRELYILPITKTPASWRKINRAMTPPDTYWVVTSEGLPSELITMLSVRPGGDTIPVAWAICSRCHNHWRMCPCLDGVVSGRSIEAMYDRMVAEANGEEWGPNHPNYLGSFTIKAKNARMRSATAGMGIAPPVRASIPAESTTGVSTPAAVGRLLPKTSRQRQILPKGEPGVSDAITDRGVIMSKIDAVAKDVAAELGAKVLRKTTTRHLPKDRSKK